MSATHSTSLSRDGQEHGVGTASRRVGRRPGHRPTDTGHDRGRGTVDPEVMPAFGAQWRLARAALALACTSWTARAAGQRTLHPLAAITEKQPREWPPFISVGVK